MKDGRQLTATINYNMVDEEMIFDQKGVYMALDRPLEIDTIYLQNRKFVPVEKAFYEVLNQRTGYMFIQHKSRYQSEAIRLMVKTKHWDLRPYRRSEVGNQVRQIDLPDNVTVSPATVLLGKDKR